VVGREGARRWIGRSRATSFYASENEQQSNVALAASVDGQKWERRGIVLSAATDDDPDTYTIGSAVFPGRWPGHG
jgi:predicted GH43/DUF377 family glycosyl hydrolase